MGKYEWVKESALRNHKGVEIIYQPEWEADKFMLRDKMFGYLGAHKDGRPIVTLKVPPEEGELLRRQHEEIIPGYYMNKQHWISVYLDGALPQSQVESLIGLAYKTVLANLPKKLREQVEK